MKCLASAVYRILRWIQQSLLLFFIHYICTFYVKMPFLIDKDSGISFLIT